MGSSREVQLMPKSEYVERLAEADRRHGNRNLKLVGDYQGMCTKAQHKCLDCGYTWDVLPRNLVNRLQGCPNCGPRKRKPTDFYLAELNKVHRGKIQFTTNRIHERTPRDLKVPRRDRLGLEAKCIVCGYTWTPVYHNSVRGFGCPKCSGSWKRSTEDFILESKDAFGDKFTYTKVDYKDRHTKVTLSCSDHGDFQVKPLHHLNSKTGGCPKCSEIRGYLAVSSVHKSVLDLLASKNIKAKVNDRKRLEGKELDVWIPSHKVGVEINGVYWHSEDRVGKHYHYHKALMCKQRGIRLLQFWDFEIRKKSKIVASMIRANLGMSNSVYARKLEVVRLDSATSHSWFNENHLQGAANSTLSYGLVDKKTSTILCAMSFTKPRFSNHEWELLRFANALGHTVVGGASRCLAAFVKDNHPTEIVSYADLRHSQGNLYRQLGFQFSHRSQPNYFYTGRGSVSRYQAQKHRLPKLLGSQFDPTKSEKANMIDAGYYRVFDAGNLVYVKQFSKTSS